MRVGRVERKVLRLNDEIASLKRDEELAMEELIMHEHLDDDAQRDAAVSDHPIDIADAKETAGDVARARAVVEKLRSNREKLEAKRDKLLASWD